MTTAMSVLALSALQTASSTAITRARNSNSLKYHALSSVIYSVIWLATFKALIINLEDINVLIGYIIGNLLGGLITHKFIMKYEGKND